MVGFQRFRVPEGFCGRKSGVLLSKCMPVLRQPLAALKAARDGKTGLSIRAKREYDAWIATDGGLDDQAHC